MAAGSSPPDYELAERIALTEPSQVKALSHSLRTTILALLHERAATVSELAVALTARDASMPADGIVMAKEAFRLVEQLQAYQGEEVASYLFHAFGTNLQFEDDEFNFVKTRAERGAKQAFELCKTHFEVPEP